MYTEMFCYCSRAFKFHIWNSFFFIFWCYPIKLKSASTIGGGGGDQGFFFLKRLTVNFAVFFLNCKADAFKEKEENKMKI